MTLRLDGVLDLNGQIIIKWKEAITPPTISRLPLELKTPLEPLTAVCSKIVMIDLELDLGVPLSETAGRTVRYEQLSGLPVTVNVSPTNILQASFTIPPTADLITPFIFDIIFDEGTPWEVTYRQLVNNTPTEYVSTGPTMTSAYNFSVFPQIQPAIYTNSGERIYESNQFALTWRTDDPNFFNVEVQQLIGSFWVTLGTYTKTDVSSFTMTGGTIYRLLSNWQVGRRNTFTINEGAFSSSSQVVSNTTWNDFVGVTPVLSSLSVNLIKFTNATEFYQDVIPGQVRTLSSSNPAVITKFTAIRETFNDSAPAAGALINTLSSITVDRFSGINIGS